MAKEPLLMICLRATERPVIKSVIKKCVDCDHDIWVSPGSVKQAEEMGAIYACLECADKRTKGMPEIRVGAITMDQVKEAVDFHKGKKWEGH